MTIKQHLKLSNSNKLDINYPIRLLNKDGKIVYYENSDGVWFKSEYDENNNRTYYEESTGFWSKKEYDQNNNRTYYEDSTGLIKGTKRQDTKELTIEEIQEKLGYKVKIVEG